jgi:ferritin-like metal-binding protein YciE
MKYKSLHDIFLLKLQSLYDIESEIIKALPKMARKATNPLLSAAFQEHLEVTKDQKERLEKIFEELGEKPKKVKVEAIRALAEDAQWLTKQDMSDEALDAVLIGAAQYVEHYEMAGYGTALAWAEHMGHDKVAGMLEETLNEEEKTDKELTSLAERAMNEKALDPSMSDED